MFKALVMMVGVFVFNTLIVNKIRRCKQYRCLYLGVGSKLKNKIMNSKWEYGEYILDFIEKKIEDKDILNTKNYIEDSHKNELVGKFNSNFSLYKKYLHIPLFFYFRELDLNIKEACDCLIIESYTASITLTNHILEKALKLALIQNEIGVLHLDLTDWSKLEVVYKKYADKPMGKILCFCKDINIGLINKDEYDELVVYKEKYRDGFSHYSPSQILNNEGKIVISTYDNNKQKIITNELSRKKVPPSFHTYLIYEFTKKNAESYLKFVLKVICHLENRLAYKLKSNNG
tara:strand:+ start:15320 stop:16186 length:867 start_codon:yes stop_codon:yes gene_type:complete